MKEEEYNINNKRKLKEFIESLKKNPEKLNSLYAHFISDFIEIKYLLDSIMDVYLNKDEKKEILYTLKQLVFQFYVQYNTINLIGNLKTNILDNRLYLDDNSIGAVLRILFELQLKIKFIFSDLKTNYNRTKFRYYVWKYCDQKSSEKDLIFYDNDQKDINKIEKLYQKIKRLKEYKNISNSEIKSIEKANWSNFHQGFLYPNSKLNRSIFNSFWYEYFSTIIHSNYSKLPNVRKYYHERPRIDNMRIYFGIASFLGKEVISLLSNLNINAIKEADIDYRLNLEEKIEIWKRDSNNIDTFEKSLVKNHTANNND